MQGANQVKNISIYALNKFIFLVRLQQMKNLYPRFLAVCTVITVLCLALSVNATEHKKTITFAQGKYSKTVKGAVVRGDRDEYLIRARSGQVMSVSISAFEKNAAFSIYEPEAEEAIPGTESENDLTKWSGSLSKTGNYRIVVGGTRGNASYKLRVKVK